MFCVFIVVLFVLITLKAEINISSLPNRLPHNFYKSNLYSEDLQLYNVNNRLTASDHLLNSIALDSSGIVNTINRRSLVQTSMIENTVVNSWEKGFSQKANWYAIATDSSGQHVAAVAYDGYIFFSDNFSSTWQKSDAPMKSWLSIACSGSGETFVAGVYSGEVFTSFDYGATWIESIVPNSNDWTSFAVSNGGKYMAATAYGVGIFFSYNYGKTWSVSTAPKDLKWFSSAIDGSGKNLVAVVYSGGIYLTSDYTRTWKLSSAPNNLPWYSVTSDESGQYLAACAASFGIYISSDYGFSWTLSSAPVNRYWQSITSSKNGKFLAAVVNGGKVYFSSDYGSSWISSCAPKSEFWVSVATNNNGDKIYAASYGSGIYNGYITKLDLVANQTSNITTVATLYPTMTPTVNPITTNTWQMVFYTNDFRSFAVACDDSGQHVVVANFPIDFGTNFGLFTSSNYGQNFTLTTTQQSFSWYALGVSRSGKYMIAGQNEGSIYYSHDYGVTWNIAIGTANKQWTSISSHCVGSFFAATSFTEGVYVSRDYGKSWNLTFSTSFSSWQGLATDRTGRFITANTYTGRMYYSSNFGSDWDIVNGTSTKINWESVAMSYNGIYQYAVSNNLGIYASINYGVEWYLTSAPTNIEWQSVACSSTGQFVAAAGQGSGLYLTTNYGVYWFIANATTDNPNYIWYSVSMNSFGNISYASSLVEGIFKGKVVANNVMVNQVPTRAPTFLNKPTSNFKDPTYAPTMRPTNYNFWKPIYSQTFSWSAIACDSDGKNVAAVAPSYGIYTSNDFGNSFENTLVGLSTDFWTSVAVSSTGQYMFATVSSGHIFFSINFGVSWNISSNSLTLLWNSVCVNNDGDVAVAIDSSGVIYKSVDYGSTWNLLFSFPKEDTWTSIASDSSGQQLIASSSGLFVSTDGGSHWSKTSAKTNDIWYSVTSDDSGQFLAAVSSDAIYASLDYGSTWIQSFTRSSFYTFLSISSSSNGLILMACTQSIIYVSTNFGIDWFDSNTTTSGNEWVKIALNSVGDYAFTVTHEGNIYLGNMTVTQSNPPTRYPTAYPTTSKPTSVPTSRPTYENIWSVLNSESLFWNGVVTSFDGYFTAAIANNSNDVYIYKDFGSTWNSSNVVVKGGTQLQLSAIACNENFTVVVVTDSVGGVYVSNSSNSKYVKTSAPNNGWTSVAVDTSGAKIIIANTFIYRSINFGNSWIKTSAPTSEWISLSSDSSGENLVALSKNYSMFTSKNGGNSWNMLKSFAIKSFSADRKGNFIVAVANDSTVRISKDFGMSWEASGVANILTSERWILSSISGTGQTIYIVDNSNEIYASVDYGQSFFESNARSYPWVSLAVDYYGSFVYSASLTAKVLYFGNLTKTIEPYYAPTLMPTSPGIIQYATAFNNKIVLDYVSFSCAISISVLKLFVSLFAIKLRRNFEKDLNEMNALQVEVYDIIIKCLNLFFSLYAIIFFASQNYIVSSYFMLLFLSKILISLVWIFFVLILFFPCKVGRFDIGRLIYTLHIESLLPVESVIGFSILVGVSVFDLTLLRLLPWKRNGLSYLLLGYPNFVLIRCCLIGTLFSSLLQVIGSFVAFYYNSALQSAIALLLIIFSLLNFVNSILSIFHLSYVNQPENSVDSNSTLAKLAALTLGERSVDRFRSQKEDVVKKYFEDQLNMNMTNNNNLSSDEDEYTKTNTSTHQAYDSFLYPASKNMIDQEKFFEIKNTFLNKFANRSNHSQHSLHTVHSMHSTHEDTGLMATSTHSKHSKHSRHSRHSRHSIHNSNNNFTVEAPLEPMSLSTILLGADLRRRDPDVEETSRRNRTKSKDLDFAEEKESSSFLSTVLNLGRKRTNSKDFSTIINNTENTLFSQFQKTQGNPLERKRSMLISSNSYHQPRKEISRNNGNEMMVDLTVNETALISSVAKNPAEKLRLMNFKSQLLAILTAANEGNSYDKNKLEYLMKSFQINPEYKAVKEAESRELREEVQEYASECLVTMRGFIPADIFEPEACQKYLDRLDSPLANRLKTKKCLWLIRLSSTALRKINDAELLEKYSTVNQGLDIVETAAIFASTPLSFSQSNKQKEIKKESWLLMLEHNMKELMKKKKNGTLSKSELRNNAYKDVVPLVDDIHQLYE